MATPRERLTETLWGPDTPGARRLSRKQSGFDGDKVTPLPYRAHFVIGTTRQRLTYWPGWYQAIDAPNTRSLHGFFAAGGIPSWAQPGYNKAYARFREEAVGSKSQIGAAFAEWKSSLGMVHKRAIGLYDASRALRRGDFRGFCRSLSVSPKRRHRNKTRAVADEASGLWLEYWFGWAPAFGDIYNALQIMERDYSPRPTFGLAGSNHFSVDDSQFAEYRDHQNIIHRVGGEVKVVNPNLFLLNQLGLANPAAIAWEVVPFSFMVDWVVDIGSYLESFTDWVGLSVDRAYSTQLMFFTDTYKNLSSSLDQRDIQTCKGMCMIRRTSIPRPLPNLQFIANLGRAKTRTATAVSLLTQTLLSMKR